MVFFRAKLSVRVKVVVFGKSDCIRAKVVVIEQMWLYSGKVVVFGQSGFVRVKVDVFEQKCCNHCFVLWRHSQFHLTVFSSVFLSCAVQFVQ